MRRIACRGDVRSHTHDNGRRPNKKIIYIVTFKTTSIRYEKPVARSGFARKDSLLASAQRFAIFASA